MQTSPTTPPRASCRSSDNSAILGLITDGDNREYRELTQDFVDWCQQNWNTGKTKELVIDFHRHKHPPAEMLPGTGRD